MENLDKEKIQYPEVVEPENTNGEENTSGENGEDDTKDILATLFKKNNLSYTNKNYSIDWLVDRLGSGKFTMPEYQRKYVWNENQVIALVASILKKLPIPKLYGYYTEEEGDDQTTLVIDGQQRLTSLFMYYWGIFPKKKNKRIVYGKKLQEIAKLCKRYYELGDQEAKKTLEKTYKLDVDYKFIYRVNEIPENQIELNLSYRDSYKESKLSNQEKFRFMDRELEFLIVEGNDYSDAVELFRLYNGGGTPLQPQEIRNGIYQNVFLYKKINEYSDSILLKDETERSEIKINKSNWNKFCGDTESKKEIQRLFQFLSYYFVFNFLKGNDDKNYEKVDSPILNLLKLNYNSYESFSMEQIKKSEVYKAYENLYRKKGSINTMINNYSDYIAKNGKDTQFMEEEYRSIVNFFDCNFEEPGKENKFNINNLIMIFLILKENDKLKESSNLIIPKEAIYYEAQGIGLSTEGFFKRIFEINKILKQRGVI